MEGKYLRRDEKILIFQQLCIAAEQLGYNRSDIAREMDVERQRVSDWFNSIRSPSDESWAKIQQLSETLKAKGVLVTMQAPIKEAYTEADTARNQRVHKRTKLDDQLQKDLE